VLPSFVNLNSVRDLPALSSQRENSRVVLQGDLAEGWRWRPAWPGRLKCPQDTISWVRGALRERLRVGALSG